MGKPGVLCCCITPGSQDRNDRFFVFLSQGIYSYRCGDPSMCGIIYQKSSQRPAQYGTCLISWKLYIVFVQASSKLVSLVHTSLGIFSDILGLVLDIFKNFLG